MFTAPEWRLVIGDQLAERIVTQLHVVHNATRANRGVVVGRDPRSPCLGPRRRFRCGGRYCPRRAERGHCDPGCATKQVVDVGVDGAVLVGDGRHLTLAVIRERHLVAATHGIGVDLGDLQQEAAGNGRSGQRASVDVLRDLVARGAVHGRDAAHVAIGVVGRQDGHVRIVGGRAARWSCCSTSWTATGTILVIEDAQDFPTRIIVSEEGYGPHRIGGCLHHAGVVVNAGRDQAGVGAARDRRVAATKLCHRWCRNPHWQPAPPNAIVPQARIGHTSHRLATAGRTQRPQTRGIVVALAGGRLDHVAGRIVTGLHCSMMVSLVDIGRRWIAAVSSSCNSLY